ncbi:hypothetical protein ABH926_009203 [Catenulispora sp. GP43]|uniref:preATP grasp domain-containing protein n=1 Tax=Catenulispora sp. GP43 TaxID=3156263 RepID=UPI003517ECF0
MTAPNHAPPHVPTAAPTGFAARLKSALTGDPHARFVYLNNFEVERVWGRGEPALPGTGLSFSAATVNRIEEVGLALAEAGDVVVLKQAPDPAYAAYLADIGLIEAAVCTVDHNDPRRTVTEDALDSPKLLAALRRLDDGHTYLAPLGVSVLEEQVAEASGLPLAGPCSVVAKEVNGKIFSRELVDAAGLTSVPGSVCRTIDDLDQALRLHLGEAGASAVVVKESLGVSGRGMVVLDSRERADRLLRMIARKSTGDGKVSLVVERWIDKRADLNYQFLVGQDGHFTFETIKTALTRDGVHRGHVFPPDLRAQEIAQLENAAAVVSKVLHTSGYHGLVGVDAILGTDGAVYPCLEINARLNMATYQNRIAERLITPGTSALATSFELRPGRTFGFDEVAAVLGRHLPTSPERLREAARGLLITNFATLNAAVVADGRPYGRLYAVLVAGNEPEVLALRGQVQATLDELMVN